MSDLFSFLRRIGLGLICPLVFTGMIGHYLLGQDSSYGIKDDLAGNLVWLVLLTLPIWAPLAFFRWVFTGRGL